MGTKKKIVMVNTEGVGKSVEEAYLQRNGYTDYELIRIDSEDDEDFFQEAEDADGVIIVYANMNEQAFSRLKKCKVLTTQCIGVNNIDLEAATRHGVYVGNVPDYCIEEVAVHTVAMFLACVRKIGIYDRSIRAGKWDVAVGGEVHRTKGKTYGLVSYGNIPKRIAELLQPFGIRVIAYDPYAKDSAFENGNAKRVDTLEELLAESDYISIHTPLLDSTRHMIGKEQFEAMKDGVVIIATGRGGVVDEEALKEAILSGKAAAAGIDVIEDEKGCNSVLKGLEQVIMTPHAAYYSEEALVEVREKAVSQILEVLEENKKPSYLVNRQQ